MQKLCWCRIAVLYASILANFRICEGMTHCEDTRALSTKEVATPDFTSSQYNVSVKDHVEICLLQRNASVQIQLDAPKTLIKMNLSHGLQFVDGSENVMYSYNGSTWFTANVTVTENGTALLFSLYALFFKFDVMNNDLQSPQCAMLTAYMCAVDAVPEVFLIPRIADLKSVVYFACISIGQPGAFISWGVLGTYKPKVISATSELYAGTDNRTEVVLMTPDLLMAHACASCAFKICQIPISCASSYLNTSASSKANSLVQLHVPLEHVVLLKIDIVTPVSMHFSWQMNLSEPGCISNSTVIMKNGIWVASMPRNVTNFYFSNLLPCQPYEVLLYTVSANFLNSTPVSFSSMTTQFTQPTIINVSVAVGFAEVIWRFSNVTCKLQEEVLVLTVECVPSPAFDMSCPSPLNVSVNLAKDRQVIQTSKMAGMRWIAFLSSDRSQFQVTNFKSNMFEFVIPDDVPESGPENLNYFEINSVSINLTWMSVPVQSRNGNITHYQVSWKSQSAVDVFVAPESNIILPREPLCSYHVAVRGCNNAGCSKSPSFISVKPILSSSNLKVLRVSEKDFVVGYFNSTTFNCSASLVTRHTTALLQGQWIAQHHFLNESGTVAVTALRPGVHYEVQVQLISLFATSDWSSSIYVDTLDGMPGQANNLTLLAGVSKLVVSWLSPTVVNGAVAYEVSIFGFRYYDSLFQDIQTKNTSTLLTVSFVVFPATEYNVSIITYNSRYANTNPLSRIATTSPFLPGAPRSSPVINYCLAVGETVTIEILSLDDRNGPISYYEIYVTVPGSVPVNIQSVNYNEAVAKNLAYYVTTRVQRFMGAKRVVLGDNTEIDGIWNKPLNLSHEFAVFYRGVINWTNSLYAGYPSAQAHYQAFYERSVAPRPPVIDYGSLTATSVSIELTASENLTSYYEVFVFATDTVPTVVESFSFSEAELLGIRYYVVKTVAGFSDKSAVVVGDGLVNLTVPQFFSYRGVRKTNNKTSVCQLSPLVKFHRNFDIRGLPIHAVSKTSIVFNLPVFGSSVDHVDVVVLRIGTNAGSFSASENANSVWNITTYGHVHTSASPLPYLAAKVDSQTLERGNLLTLGTGDQAVVSRNRRSIFPSNGPLDSGTYYSFFFRVHDKNGGIASTSWHEPVKTVSEIAASRSRISSPVKAAIIVCSVLAVFILFALMLLRWWWKARQQNADKSSSIEMKSQSESGKVNYAFESELANTKRRPYTLTYSIDLQHSPIPIAEFPDHVAILKDSNGFVGEFEQLETVVDLTCDVAKDPVNSRKNRYEDVLPFDNSRVKLAPTKSSDSDYINASFVDGYDMPNAYIATQGPLPETLDDFWKMVWQENCYTIIMLCSMVESGIIKCSHYWPKASKKEKYGNVSVKRVDRFQYDGYTVTSLLVQQNSNAVREIRLYHFANWPDSVVPTSSTQILACRSDVRRWSRKHQGPVLVHCSAGIGRTGAFIALDAILKNIPRSGTVDIFNFVNYLRQRRVNMVQTVNQYEFIHDAILETLTQTPSVAEVSKDTIAVIIADLAAVDEVTGYSGFQKLFKKLNKNGTAPNVDRSLVGRLPENAYKNRYAYKVPVDCFRVTLPTKSNPGSIELSSSYPRLTMSGSDTDFINATNLSESLITTQSPLGFTLQDFWLMVSVRNVRTIVMLNEVGEDATCPQYWPESSGQSLDYGSFQVCLASQSAALNGVIEREFKLVDEKEERKIASYQFCAWPERGVPSSPRPVVAVVQSLVGLRESSGVVVVVCSDGLGRSGCFCACLLAIKELNRCGKVDVVKLLTEMRERHPGYMETESQFSFLFDVIRSYCS